jgi:hypothetical protein
MPAKFTNHRERPLAAIGLLAVSLLIAACGAGATAAGPTPGASDAPAQPPAGDTATAADGEYADEAWIANAVAALQAHDSYTFEIETTSESSYGEELRRTFGVVRPVDDAAVVNFEIEGSGSQYVTIGEKSWIDFGDGQYRPRDEPDESREAMQAVWDEFFASFADDFVIAGNETVHGRATVHVVIDPYLVEKKVEMFVEEYRPWTIELWLAEGRRPPRPRDLRRRPRPDQLLGAASTLDVKSIDCECPVTEPRAG